MNVLRPGLLASAALALCAVSPRVMAQAKVKVAKVVSVASKSLTDPGRGCKL